MFKTNTVREVFKGLWSVLWKILGSKSYGNFPNGWGIDNNWPNAILIGNFKEGELNGEGITVLDNG